MAAARPGIRVVGEHGSMGAWQPQGLPLANVLLSPGKYWRRKEAWQPQGLPLLYYGFACSQELASEVHESSSYWSMMEESIEMRSPLRRAILSMRCPW